MIYTIPASRPFPPPPHHPGPLFLLSSRTVESTVARFEAHRAQNLDSKYPNSVESIAWVDPDRGDLLGVT